MFIIFKINIEYNGDVKTFKGASFNNGTKIEMKKTYRVAMPDFLFKGGLDFAKIIEWYNPRDF